MTARLPVKPPLETVCDVYVCVLEILSEKGDMSDLQFYSSALDLEDNRVQQ